MKLVHPKSLNSLTIAVVACSVALCPMVAFAQGRIVGTVVDTGGKALANAEAVLSPSERVGLTDRNGRFRFDGVARGDYTLLVRAVGFDPVRTAIQVSDRGEWSGRIILKAGEVRLEDVTVEARWNKPRRLAHTTKYDDFYRRRASQAGVFIDREELVAAGWDRKHDIGTVLALRSIPGVRRIGGSLRVDRCEGQALVLVDGFPDPNGLLLNPRSIEGVEVYRGSAQIPVEFSRRFCAVVLIWTGGLASEP